ncbi:unnamed protein product [Effrenium voratum]|uniref:Uncharacterized protein n=1 Tax=Effrenium voratum TaxID=2562239 RepID=A0AA36I7A5_9DINO|nr:unnamed protein product [Effrenium voratum]CAJ1380989.1 unnamed protein product [Effrenium voratum]
MAKLLSALFFLSAAKASLGQCESGACLDDDEAVRMGVELLQHKVELGKQRVLDAVNATKDIKQPAIISAMYTFGAPAVSKPPMPDLARDDKCFQGLRTYTENKLPGGGRQVDAASMFDAYPHPHISVLALDWAQDSYYQPCPGDATWPKGGGAADWGLHSETHYSPRLKEVTLDGVKMAEQEPFKTANDMVILAYKSYDSVENTIKELKEKLPKWRLVERRVFEWSQGAYDDDPIMVAQNVDTLDCALIFTGTNHFGELGSSVKQHLTGYCGFDQIHAGYRDEVWQLSDHTVWPKITAKLAKCASVRCVGHSLGGAMCDVFSGCINSGRADDPDYQKLMWWQGTPELMPEVGVEELGAAATLGTVDSLYTYGSPATSDPPLKDATTKSGCWKGLRAYCENDLSGGGKQADARVLNQNYFPHPTMNTLSLQWGKDSHLAECSGKPEDSVWWPHHNAMVYEDWYVHTEQNYADRLEKLNKDFPKIEIYEEGALFVHLAFGAEHPQKELEATMQKHMPNWALVERTPLLDEHEPALLAQDQVNFDCALVMPGNKANRGQHYGTGFCGLVNVHSGYRDYLVSSVQTPGWQKIAQKLPQCRRVICAGHSRGGSVCELFAACAWVCDKPGQP